MIQRAFEYAAIVAVAFLIVWVIARGILFATDVMKEMWLYAL